MKEDKTQDDGLFLQVQKGTLEERDAFIFSVYALRSLYPELTIIDCEEFIKKHYF